MCKVCCNPRERQAQSVQPEHSASAHQDGDSQQGDQQEAAGETESGVAPSDTIRGLMMAEIEDTTGSTICDIKYMTGSAMGVYSYKKSLSFLGPIFFKAYPS